MGEPGDPFEIVEIPVRGVPTLTWKQAPNSLREVWKASAVYGPNDFLVYQQERLTFDDAHRAVRSIAHWMVAERGVSPPSRCRPPCGSTTPNCPATPVARSSSASFARA